MKYYDPGTGRYRIKRRYVYGALGFGAGLLVGALMAALIF